MAHCELKKLIRENWSDKKNCSILRFLDARTNVIRFIGFNIHASFTHAFTLLLSEGRKGNDDFETKKGAQGAANGCGSRYSEL